MKLDLHTLVKRGLDWDDMLPDKMMQELGKIKIQRLSYLSTMLCITFPNVRCSNRQTMTFKNNTTFLKPFIFIYF